MGGQDDPPGQQDVCWGEGGSAVEVVTLSSLSKVNIASTQETPCYEPQYKNQDVLRAEQSSFNCTPESHAVPGADIPAGRKPGPGAHVLHAAWCLVRALKLAPTLR